MQQKYFSEADLVDMLKRRAEELGTQAELARQLGLTRAYVSDVLAGRRRLSERVAGMLGMESVYVRINDRGRA